MRIAGHTYSYRHLPLGAALDELGELGFSRIEVWLGHEGDDDPRSVAAALAARGLEAAAVGAGGFYDADPDAVDRAVAFARALGAHVLVACAAADVIGAVLDRVPEDVVFCVENHWDQPLSRPRAVARSLEVHPRLAACVDTGHALLAGVPPDRFVTSLGRRVGHVHLKDAALPPLYERLAGRRLRARFLPRPRPVAPGAGALDAGRVRAALEAAGFAGTVTMEHEGGEVGEALAQLLEAWA